MSLVLACPLHALSASDAAAFGGKSASLGELVSAGIPVPPGFALSTAAYEVFVAEAGLAPAIDSALEGVGPADQGAVSEAADAIAAAMGAATVPEAVREEIARGYAALPGDEPAVAVRSSAVGEDSAE